MPASIAIEQAVSQVLAVLDETIEPPETPWSYFSDHGPDAGLTGSLRDLSAAEASVIVGGTSIAQHVFHVIFSMNASASWIRGEGKQFDWDKSWAEAAVDEATWSAMREKIRAGHESLRAAVQSRAGHDEKSFGSAVGAAAHLAYHLGAIRQKRAVVKGMARP